VGRWPGEDEDFHLVLYSAPAWQQHLLLERSHVLLVVIDHWLYYWATESCS